MYYDISVGENYNAAALHHAMVRRPSLMYGGVYFFQSKPLAGFNIYYIYCILIFKEVFSGSPIQLITHRDSLHFYSNKRKVKQIHHVFKIKSNPIAGILHI